MIPYLCLSLILLLIYPTYAGQIEFDKATGRVTGYRDSPKDVKGNKEKLDVTQRPTWPVPPSAKWTTCAEGHQDWTKHDKGSLLFDPSITLFHCHPVSSRQEVLSLLNDELKSAGNLAEFILTGKTTLSPRLQQLSDEAQILLTEKGW